MRKRKKEGIFEEGNWLKKPLILILLFVSFSTLGQVEDLIKKYPKQKGKERVQTIIDISYALHVEDVSKSKYYGKLAEKEAKKIGDSALLATVWNDWSFVYLFSGNLDSALLLNQQALEYRTLLKDSMGMAKSLNKIAMAYYEKGDYTKSLSANFESLDYFKQLKLEPIYGQVYNNIAAIYEATNNFERALVYYTKAVDNAHKFDDIYPETRARINRGKCLKNLQRFEDARAEYLTALPIAIEIDDPETLGNLYLNMGVLEREQFKNNQLAMKYYELSLKNYRDAEMITAIPLLLKNLSNLYIELGKLDVAENYLNEALELANESSSIIIQKEVYQMFARLETIKGNSDKADGYLEKYIALSDSIHEKENVKAIAEMQAKFDAEERELELAEQKIKTKNATIGLLIAGSCIFLLIVLAWYIAQRKRIESKNAAIRNYQNLERERSRIARDLHDNLGAELTMITSKIDMKSFKASNDIDKSELEEIGQISRSANHMLRETIWSIHQDEISLRELHSKAKAYAERVFADQAVMVSTRVYDEDCVISPAVALHLFRITQESVNNAFKYANCSEFSIIIRKNQIELRDNGTGFDATIVQKGYGLQNMQERANEMQATLMMESNKENGTKIVVSLS